MAFDARFPATRPVARRKAEKFGPVIGEKAALRVDQGVILIGGCNTQSGASTRTVSKPMLEIGGLRFIEHVISHFARFGVRRILLLAVAGDCLAHDLYHGRKLYGAELSVLIEPNQNGIAGTLLSAVGRLDELFLFAHGDVFFDTNLLPLLRAMLKPKWDAAMLLHRGEGGSRFGQVTVDEQGAVRSFAENPLGQQAFANAGIHLIRRDAIITAINKPSCSLESNIFPRLAGGGRLVGVEADGYFVDIANPSGRAHAHSNLVKQRTRPAAFLDRDGVLNVDRGFTHAIEHLEWTRDAPAAVRLLNEAGYYVFVVTNQAGVARGYYTEGDVERFHAHMQDRLMAAGAHVDAFYYCPHHPQGVIRALAIECACRKPKPGLLEQAARDWFIDRGGSFLIGDREGDVAAAAAFGIRGVRFDARCQSLLEVVHEQVASAMAIFRS